MERYIYDANEKDTWKEISIAIRNRTCILLTGLGFSLLGQTHTEISQFPQTQHDLLHKMYEWCINEKSIQSSEKELHKFEDLLNHKLFKDAEHIIEEYLTDNSKKQACLKAILEQNKADLIYLSRLIVQIPFRAYLTTSYDTFIEDQYEKVNGPATTLVRYNKTSIYKAIDDYQRNKPFILKLHDDINSPVPMVLSNRIQDIPYPSELRKILSDLSIILLGFAQTDPDLEDLKRLFSIKKGVKHWLLVPKGQLSLHNREQLWENNKIATIEYATISDLKNSFVEIEKLSSAIRTIKVYTSYVSENRDVKIKEELMKQLKGGIEFQELDIDWGEGDIGAGKEKEPAILDRLKNAEIILLFISSDYLYSLTNNRVIELEMKKAVQKHHDGEARVIPVILRPCLWENKPLLNDLQVLPQKNEKPIKPISSWPSSKRDEIYKDIAIAIRAAIAEWSQEH